MSPTAPLPLTVTGQAGPTRVGPDPFAAAQLGPITLRNRVIKAAAFEGATPDALVSDRLIDFHTAVGRGGIGMTTVAYCAVAPEGRTERDQLYWSIIRAQSSKPEHTASDAIAAAAHQMVDALELDTIMAWTHSGSTALRLSRERPNASVIALTPKRETARRLAMAWGTHPIVTKDASDVDDMAFRACKFAVRERFAEIGDRVIVVAGVPFGTPGATNLVRIAFITREHAERA